MSHRALTRSVHACWICCVKPAPTALSICDPPGVFSISALASVAFHAVSICRLLPCLARQTERDEGARKWGAPDGSLFQLISHIFGSSGNPVIRKSIVLFRVDTNTPLPSQEHLRSSNWLVSYHEPLLNEQDVWHLEWLRQEGECH